MVYSGGEQELSKVIASNPNATKKVMNAGINYAKNNPEVMAAGVNYARNNPEVVMAGAQAYGGSNPYAM